MNWKHFSACFVLYLIGIVSGISEMSFVTSWAPVVLLSFLLSIASSFVIIFIAKKIEWCKPLIFIGKNSLVILCVHLLDMTVIGAYTWKVYAWLGLPNTFLARFLQDLFWIAVVTALVLVVKKISLSHKKVVAVAPTNGRDETVDIAKAVLIMLMLIGHQRVGLHLNRMLYSFHMMAFVFLEVIVINQLLVKM